MTSTTRTAPAFLGDTVCAHRDAAIRVDVQWVGPNAYRVTVSTGSVVARPFNNREHDASLPTAAQAFAYADGLAALHGEPKDEVAQFVDAVTKVAAKARFTAAQRATVLAKVKAVAAKAAAKGHGVEGVKRAVDIYLRGEQVFAEAGGRFTLSAALSDLRVECESDADREANDRVAAGIAAMLRGKPAVEDRYAAALDARAAVVFERNGSHWSNRSGRVA